MFFLLHGFIVLTRVNVVVLYVCVWYRVRSSSSCLWMILRLQLTTANTTFRIVTVHYPTEPRSWSRRLVLSLNSPHLTENIDVFLSDQYTLTQTSKQNNCLFLQPDLFSSSDLLFRSVPVVMFSSDSLCFSI